MVMMVVGEEIEGVTEEMRVLVIVVVVVVEEEMEERGSRRGTAEGHDKQPKIYATRVLSRSREHVLKQQNLTPFPAPCWTPTPLLV